MLRLVHAGVVSVVAAAASATDTMEAEEQHVGESGAPAAAVAFGDFGSTESVCWLRSQVHERSANEREQRDEMSVCI